MDVSAIKPQDNVLNGQSTQEIGFHNIIEKVAGGDCPPEIFNSLSKLPGGEVIYRLRELN